MPDINEYVKVKLKSTPYKTEEVVTTSLFDADGYFLAEVTKGDLKGWRVRVHKSEIVQEKLIMTAKEAKELSDKAMLPKRLEQIFHRIKCQAERGCYTLFLSEREMLIKPSDLSAYPYNYRVTRNESGYVISWE